MFQTCDLLTQHVWLNLIDRRSTFRNVFESNTRECGYADEVQGHRSHRRGRGRHGRPGADVPAAATRPVPAASAAARQGRVRQRRDNAGKRACVMLPDADSSSRWENGDRPALQKGFEEAGFEVDIQNALNDTGKYATLADQQLTKGCSVMLLVDLNGAGVQVATKAKAQGIPVIAYDRPIKGADLYISFDNFQVGELQGQMIVDAMKAKGTDIATANIVYVGGDPTDGNAKQFHDGADKTLKAAGMTAPAFETPGAWDATKSGVAFEQALHRAGGQGRRSLGGQRHQRRCGHPGAGQERPDHPGQRPGRVADRPAERPAGQAVRHGLQAVPARGRVRGRRTPSSWPTARRRPPTRRLPTARRSSRRTRPS